ncbi:unnamed protein product [Adineta steineri]|uniref:RBR-type E3 ubiquitin transferase n=1 Tax=Adineta steineri TaxID=433720 RepID=A0A819EGJ5_9BILA|nr:unnamed protein product [Adineta steineri]CAF3851748.1 unnamed protein product [Adineta steineri]
MLQHLVYNIEGNVRQLLSGQIQDIHHNKTISEQSCAVCMETKLLEEFETYYTNNCVHPNRRICNNCLYEYIRNTWNIGSNINCPECSIPLSHITIHEILLNHDDNALYERYEQFDLNRSLEQHPEFIWCAHGCGSGQLNEGATMNKIVQCVNCHKLTCFTHRCPWHDGMTCEEYEMPRTNGQMHASERWINVNTKECPTCHSHIEKNEGCDHMTCWKCKYEFCWECLAPYSNIKQYGVYLHRRTCKHYPTTDTRNIFKRFIDHF